MPTVMIMVVLMLWVPRVQSSNYELCKLLCRLECSFVEHRKGCILKCIANNCRRPIPEGVGYCRLGCVISTCSGFGSDADADNASRCADACSDSCTKSYNIASISTMKNQKNN
ncbi:thionin-like protein 2 [Eucalyptus grandis]|uniref:thionin-like protein 2 n=1 Tax=Eucalyptus grandis TaxID=71139 RepID=UPI00192EF5A9|nr:thionin-like protein 2 [Eucalyptus grandis]